MGEAQSAAVSSETWGLEATGPVSLAQVMRDEEARAARGDVARMAPLATGFEPLDELLNGGLRPGELLVIGGPHGVGKTIWGLQAARNAVQLNQGAAATYVCYEHSRAHLMQRLICLESAERGYGEYALTLRDLSRLTSDTSDGAGLICRLERIARYAPLVEAIKAYAERLILVQASGQYTTLDQVRTWVQEIVAQRAQRMLLVVDYLQKIPVDWSALQPETEVTTYLTHGLKEMAMAMGLPVVAIAAADRAGLKSKRMRLSDLRGSSAVQYEADIGLILNNKWSIVSREHLVYNLAEAEKTRGYLVLSVEKNRSGRSAVDMEFGFDAAHFRIVRKGDLVRERLVDDKVVMA